MDGLSCVLVAGKRDLNAPYKSLVSNGMSEADKDAYIKTHVEEIVKQT